MRKRSDRRPLFGTHAGRDELENSSLVVGHTEGGILTLHQLPCRVRDILEHIREIECTGDGGDSGIGCVQFTHVPRDLLIRHREILDLALQLFVERLDPLLSLLALRDVPRDVRESHVLSLVVMDRCTDDVRPETGTIFAHPPAFGLVLTQASCLGERSSRHALVHVFRSGRRWRVACPESPQRGTPSPALHPHSTT